MYFDGHSDLLYDVVRRRSTGEKQVLERRHRAALQRGSVEGLVLSFWTAWEGILVKSTPAQRLEWMFAAAQAELRESPWLRVVRWAEEAEAVRRSGKIYAFFSLEGMDAMGEDPAWVDLWALRGVRSGMLTWNGDNQLASGASGDRLRGLTFLGREVLRRMEQQRMLVDVSHLNDRGFWDVLRMAHGPVLASHSNCRALCDVPRNLSDEQLRAIRNTGGVVGLNAFHRFVHAEREKQTAEMLARHAAHMADVMGVEHVACGFDFCHYFGPGNEGAEGMEHCGQIKNLFYWLEKLGMQKKERELVARGNLLRIFSKRGG